MKTGAPAIVNLQEVEPEKISNDELTQFFGKRKNRSVDIQKNFENPENWYTIYQAVKELKIPQEKFFRFILEYEISEPDYIIEKETKLNDSFGSIHKSIYIYKALLEEIKKRVESGEKKIIPKDWKNINEFSEEIGWINEGESLDSILEYLFGEDEKIKKIWQAESYKTMVEKKPKMVIKEKKDYYFSPEFQEILKNRIIELKDVFIPNGYDLIRGLRTDLVNEFKSGKFADFREVMQIFAELYNKYKSKAISKITDYHLSKYYPQEFFWELEKKLSEIRLS